MKAEIGLTDKNSRTIAETLNKLLADEHIVYTKTRNYHWNYEGDNFMEMHKFYEGQYEELAEMIDEIAERIRMIGHHAEGRLKDFLNLTNLEEENYTTDQNEQVRNLTDDHQTIIRVLRNGLDKIDKLKDAGTVDLLTKIMEQHEKMAWMLRSYLP
jgi:starvation-inducible DNA-binding protein